MRLLRQLLTENNCYAANEPMEPKGIMWHSTGANNPNIKRYVQPDDGILGTNKYGNHWNQPTPGGREVCTHAFIGKVADGTIATYQTLPWNTKGWHAGGSANDTHIGFEICEDDLTSKEYFEAVYKEAVGFSAYLCKLHSFDPLADGVIISHSEGFARGIASNHMDVGHWLSKFGKTMNDVRNDIKKEMEKEDMSKLYRVQVGSYRIRENAVNRLNELKELGYTDAFIAEVDIDDTEDTPTVIVKVPRPTKTTDEIAKEIVIKDNWGKGDIRKSNLAEAGYTEEEIEEIQDKVNALMGKHKMS